MLSRNGWMARKLSSYKTLSSDKNLSSHKSLRGENCQAKVFPEM